MKRILAVTLALMVALSFLSACISNTEESSGELAENIAEETMEERMEEEVESLRVALVVPESINDGGWNSSAYNGLLLIQEKYGAEISFTENVQLSENDEVFRMYAEEGYDIVFGHGNEFADSAKRVAPSYPNTQFCITASDIVQEPNVSSLNTDNAQQGFISGVLAATLSESGSVGIVAGMNIPSISDCVTGFELGAKYVDEDIEVRSTYVGDFVDAAKGKEIAYSMIDAGVDIIMHNAGTAGNGVFEACEVGGIMAIGAVADQSDYAPDTIVSSAIADMPRAFTAFVELYMSDDFMQVSGAFGVAEDTIYLAPYHNFEDEISNEQKEVVQKVLEDIRSGALNVRDFGSFNL